MRTLGLALGLFAAATAAVAASLGDTWLWLLAGAAAINAATTLRAGGVSSFLKIFIAIFGVETVAFGAAVIAQRAGLWPEALNEYQLPESLPVSVAVFSILTFAVSHLPVVRAMTRIADRYFEADDVGSAQVWPLPAFSGLERRIAVAMVIALVLINQAQVAILVRLSFFNRDWFNAIQEKNADEFWRLLLWVFTPWAFIYVTSAVVEFVMQSMLIVRWRRWLTERYVTNWLAGAAHYRMSLSGGEADNPDQRIAEDVSRFIDGGQVGYGVYTYSILLISTLSSLVSFSIVLWGLSSNFVFPGTSVVVPGFLFWVALLYATIGTIITHVIGRSLVKLSFERQRVEADFRFSLARLREYGEQVALLGGETTERRSLMGRFGAIIANYLAVVDRRKKLMAFTQTYGQLSPIIPYIFTAPFYFGGKITLGVMTQTAAAFARRGALTFFITYYTSLADFKAVLDRLTSFDAAIERAQAQPGLAVAPSSDGRVHVEGLKVGLPDGRPVVAVDALTLEPGRHVLLTGPSGSGKSTLFRALSGVWPYATGALREPGGVMLAPQRPYLPNGALRGAIAYPAAADAYSDADIRAALDAVKLPWLGDKLDEVDQWQQRLSGGEQQRVALARAILAKPKWLLLDESTSALDEPTEAAIYETLKRMSPETTLVSIGHRSTLIALHDRHLALEADGAGVFSPRDLAPAR
ncbi:MAG: ABC transporter ATP-binding protein/permease [Rhodoblastus sp.]|nr:MAG: ABC transporter ATP-binding protein/permease [Rhodoblastus sp.]